MQTLILNALTPSTRWLPGRILVPGMLLTAAIAAAAFELRQLSGITG